MKTSRFQKTQAPGNKSNFAEQKQLNVKCLANSENNRKNGSTGSMMSILAGKVDSFKSEIASLDDILIVLRRFHFCSEKVVNIKRRVSAMKATFRLLNVPRQTVSDATCRFEELGNDGRRPGSGRKRIVNTSKQSL
ncbi:hypothetical protein TNCV_1867641 [Trichonephila clavipes]|nr:hypothetical protein TNCV_1867641 [Trichonephila clavipes]